jgi:hypothetical protein
MKGISSFLTMKKPLKSRKDKKAHHRHCERKRYRSPSQAL